jgi:hypothetical protein
LPIKSSDCYIIAVTLIRRNAIQGKKKTKKNFARNWQTIIPRNSTEKPSVAIFLPFLVCKVILPIYSWVISDWYSCLHICAGLSSISALYVAVFYNMDATIVFSCPPLKIRGEFT